MKHTFWYIDQLMILLSDRILIGDWNEHKGELRTDSEKDSARAMLLKIKKYDLILRSLIDSHKTEMQLKTLHNCHIDRIPDWAERVNEQFRKLDALLKVLEEDIPKLEQAIEYEPKMWGSRVQDMSLGFIQAGFHDAELNMEEFRRASIFEREHLQDIIGDLKEIEGILE